MSDGATGKPQGKNFLLKRYTDYSASHHQRPKKDVAWELHVFNGPPLREQRLI